MLRYSLTIAFGGDPLWQPTEVILTVSIVDVGEQFRTLSLQVIATAQFQPVHIQRFGDFVHLLLVGGAGLQRAAQRPQAPG